MSPYLQPLHRLLILTPDSVASTYFQRLTTMYLNLNGITTVNFHDLVNHYDEGFRKLLRKLTSKQDSVVCRLSQYRLIEVNEPHSSFFKACNLFFQRKFCLRRCSFETALSLSMREYFSHPLNVYSHDQYKHYKENTTPSTIPIDLFIEKLKHIEHHFSWVDKNFTHVEYIDHEDFITDTDLTLKKLFNIENRLDFSFTAINKNIFLSDRGFSKLNDASSDFLERIKSLENIYPDFPFRVPRKKFTLSEKKVYVSNFDNLLQTYSNYSSNHLEKVTSEDLEKRIVREDKLFGLS